MIGFIIASVLSVAGSAIMGKKSIDAQKEMAEKARQVAPPPMERSDDEATVRLGTIDNELSPSSSQGSAQAATQRTNQIGQVGGQ